jgi:hypothetical protein
LGVEGAAKNTVRNVIGVGSSGHWHTLSGQSHPTERN